MLIPTVVDNSVYAVLDKSSFEMGYHRASAYDSDPDFEFNTSHSDSNLNRKFEISLYGEDFDLDTTLYEEYFGLTLIPCPGPECER